MNKVIAIALGSTLMFASQAMAGTGTAKTGEYENYCAWGMTQGKQVHTDCHINWKEASSGKTYCFSSEDAKKSWAENTTTNMTKADAEFAKWHRHGHDHDEHASAADTSKTL